MRKFRSRRKKVFIGEEEKGRMGSGLEISVYS